MAPWPALAARSSSACTDCRRPSVFRSSLTTARPAPLSIDGRSDLLSPDDGTFGQVADLVSSWRASGGTDDGQALRRALAYHPDLLYFLTDADDLDPDDVRTVMRLNDHRTVIHAVQVVLPHRDWTARCTSWRPTTAGRISGSIPMNDCLWWVGLSRKVAQQTGWTGRLLRSSPDRVHGPLRLHEPRRVDLVPFPLARARSCGSPPPAPRRPPGRAATAFTSTSSSANRQLRSLPSAVRRRRLQLRQNGRDTEAMMPTRPPPSV